MTTPVLRVDALTVRLHGRALFERFSLSLSEGERITVTGRSGSGKSTLLRCVVGFVSPDEGCIHVKGERLSDRTIWRLRCLMAYVPQEPDLGVGSVRAILEEPFTYRANLALRSSLERIPDLFERLFLPLALLDRDMSDLSGGEKQRIAIVSAMLLQREILLLDEATSALDKGARLALAEYLKSEKNITILSVAHDASDLPLAGTVVPLQEHDFETTGPRDNRIPGSDDHETIRLKD